MANIISPLRYPGGKGKIFNFVKDILSLNNVSGNYVEPFAGGAGVGLKLLLHNCVEDIYLNDKDRSIYAFWYSILNYTDKFINKINIVDVTIEEFKKQQIVQKNKERADIFDLGFSTFFLNRTTRSGILKGGVIGGLKQNGKYLIDVRFNKKNLINRIKEIAKYKEHIHIYNEDAIYFLKNRLTELPRKNTFIYLDPPYYYKGHKLYMNYYTKEDHLFLFKAIIKMKHYWMVSYDNSLEIRKIYEKVKNKFTFDINYSAATKTKGIEILFFKENIKIPSKSIANLRQLK